MLRQWKCTNADCEMNREGLVRMTGDPAYALVSCDKCGAKMDPVQVLDTKVVFVGDYPDTVLSSGALPIAWPQVGLLGRLLGRQVAPCITDPDVERYPAIEQVRADPGVVRQGIDLFEYLQTADAFLVSREGRGAAVVVVRCPSHHLAVPLSQSPPVGIHMEAHRVGSYELFGLYVLVWDNPTRPWFAEHVMCPYDVAGANDQELADPVGHLNWRKLFYLLTQESTELLMIDEENRIAAVRNASLRAGQAAQFLRLVRRLDDCAGQRIPKPDLLDIHSRYPQDVPAGEVEARFPRL